MLSPRRGVEIPLAPMDSGYSAPHRARAVPDRVERGLRGHWSAPSPIPPSSDLGAPISVAIPEPLGRTGGGGTAAGEDSRQTLASRFGPRYLMARLAVAKDRKEQNEDQEDDVADTSDPKKAPEDEDERDDEDEEEGDEGDDEEEEEKEDEDSDDEESDEESEEQDEEPDSKVGEHDRGRVKLWIGLGVVVVIAAIFLMKRESPSESGGQAPLPAVGTTLAADLTLVTADRNDLDCAAEKGVNNYLCGFVDEKTPRQVQESDKLRPYMTLDRHLYLIPGLFLEPAIAERFKSEPPTKPREQLRRFTAKCKVKIAGELDGVKLRWSPSGNWEQAKKFPVANISDCKIEG